MNTAMAAVMPHKSFDDIKDSVRESIVLVDVQRNSEGITHFEVKQLPLAELQIYDVSIAAITIHRREEDIREDGIDGFFLSMLVEGEAVFEQDGICFTMKPGELAINAGGSPFSIQYTKPSRRLLLKIPKQVFFERILGRRERAITALHLGNGGLASIVINMFMSLNNEAEMLPETDQYTLSESFLELAGVVIRAAATVDKSRPKDSQAALMRRILAYMDKNHADCELTPEKVAEANGISMRYLHRVFQQSGMAVSKWIWERRLKASREDLLDPAKGQMRISEIAFSRGFNDPAHFSRSFRDRFGISPSKLRAKSAAEQNAKTYS